MIDLFLRFDDEAAAIAALPWLRDGALWRVAGPGFAFDPIGTLWSPGAWDDETARYAVAPAPKDGWHANLRCTPALAVRVPATARIQPTTPDRVFA